MATENCYYKKLLKAKLIASSFFVTFLQQPRRNKHMRLFF